MSHFFMLFMWNNVWQVVSIVVTICNEANRVAIKGGGASLLKAEANEKTNIHSFLDWYYKNDSYVKNTDAFYAERKSKTKHQWKLVMSLYSSISDQSTCNAI